MPASVTLTGFKEFEAKLQNLPATVMKEVDGEVQDAALFWVQRSKNDAPVDQGRLRNQLSEKKITLGTWDVVSPVEYSAFLEWGTRGRVKVPAELQAYASQFRNVNTPGGAKKFIYDWCKRKGIDPSLWYVIYRSIMINGIHPRPFFFPQKPFVEKQLLNNLKAILNAEH